MEKSESIQIEIHGDVEKEVTPENFDIRDIAKFFEIVENLLFPENKKNRPIISYSIQSGSVKQIFTTRKEVIEKFTNNCKQIQSKKNLDGLDSKFVEAFQSLQKYSEKYGSIIKIQSSIDKDFIFQIDKTSNYLYNEDIWVNSEFYFYGKIIKAGGKENTIIEIQTDKEIFKIQTPVDFFSKLKENIIYTKTYGIRAVGKQNLNTGEIDKSSFRFVELINYDPTADEDYLKNLRKKAKTWLVQINPDSWLREIRGYAE